MLKQKQVPQSASRIKTLNNCSWVYHCNYILKIPDESNDGARRGTVTHNVLECLLPERRRHYFDEIMGNGTVKDSAAVWRLVEIHAKKLGVADENNLDMIDGFILTALRADFYCDEEKEYGEAKLLPPETTFNLKNDDPSYWILGFIDKICLYPDISTIRIVDYKTSKQKFSGEEKDFNTQAMMYCLAALSLFPEYERAMCDFLFLKFPKNPVMRVEFSREQLAGFELYLEHLDGYLSGFSLRHATSNYAADNYKNRWLCGKKKGELNKAGDAPAFVCKYKYPSDYYVVADADGKILKSSFEEGDPEIVEFAKSEGLEIEKKRYDGCPKFKNRLK